MTAAPPPPAPRPRSALDQPISLRSCLLGALLWGALFALPVLLFLLAVKGELTWRRGEFVEDRLWLVSPSRGSGGEQGLAYSAARLASDDSRSGGSLCVRTRVIFLLWKGQSENLSFCDCYQPLPAGGYEPAARPPSGGGACP